MITETPVMGTFTAKCVCVVPVCVFRRWRPVDCLPVKQKCRHPRRFSLRRPASPSATDGKLPGQELQRCCWVDKPAPPLPAGQAELTGCAAWLLRCLSQVGEWDRILHHDHPQLLLLDGHSSKKVGTFPSCVEK